MDGQEWLSACEAADYVHYLVDYPLNHLVPGGQAYHPAKPPNATYHRWRFYRSRLDHFLEGQSPLATYWLSGISTILPPLTGLRIASKCYGSPSPSLVLRSARWSRHEQGPAYPIRRPHRMIAPGMEDYA